MKTILHEIHNDLSNYEDTKTKLDKSYNINMKIIHNEMNKYKINRKKIDNDIHKYMSDFSIDNPNTKNFNNNIATIVKKNIPEEGTTWPTVVLKSTIAVIFIYIINKIIKNNIESKIKNELIRELLLKTLIVPFLEELFFQKAIKTNNPYIFTGVLAGLEVGKYIIQSYKSDAGITGKLESLAKKSGRRVVELFLLTYIQRFIEKYPERNPYADPSKLQKVLPGLITVTFEVIKNFGLVSEIVMKQFNTMKV